VNPAHELSAPSDVYLLVMPESGKVMAAHTFGAIVRGRELRGLSVEEVLMPPGLCVPEHGHEGAQIYFLLEGEYTETIRGERHCLRPGGAWLRPPRESHRNEVLGDDAALTLIVTIEAQRFTELAATASPRPLHSVVLGEVRDELLRELRGGDEASATALEGWSLLLLSRTQRLLTAGADRAGPGEAPEWLQDARAYLEASFRGPVSLSTAAARVGVHPATLAAAFRRLLGASVGEYIRDLRLRSARQSLLDTRLPIDEIALECGFYDQAHLGRCFRRRFGASPAAFRAGAHLVH
jgi:AraC family transcriptional regulator